MDPLITRSRQITHAHRQIVFALLLVLGLVLLVAGALRHADWVAQRQALAEATLNGAMKNLTVLLQEQHRLAGLLVDAESEALRVLVDAPDDAGALARLEAGLKRILPEAINVALVDPSGLLQSSSNPELIGERCLSDLALDPLGSRRALAVIHPMPGHYHYDVLTEFAHQGEYHALVLALPPSLLAEVLKTAGMPGLQLVLALPDDGLIEVSAAGSREEVGEVQTLTDLKGWTMITSGTVAGTRWRMVALADEALAQGMLWQLTLTLGGIYLLILLAAAWGYRWVNHADRSMAEQARLLVAANAQLRFMSLHDPLTTLPNRTLLGERLEQAVLTGTRRGQMFALALIDVSRFKDINESKGHAVGDEVLVELASRIKSVLRSSDTVARTGGDEFAVLVFVDDSDQAVALGAKVFAQFEAPLVFGDDEIKVDANMGMALFPDHAREPSLLLQCTDIALSEARESSNRIVLYSSEVDPHSMDRLALMGGLREAASAGELVLCYQPQVDLVSGQLHGVEALVRWQHPTHGLLGPGLFVPLAEQSGAITGMTYWALEQAMNEFLALALPAGVRCAVNLSPRVLDDPQLLEVVAELLRRHPQAADCLKLEITETALLADSNKGLKAMARLAELGLRMSVDDFGTGYSSLAYLKRMPVQELKLDQAFVTAMENDASDRAIVQSTVDLAHSLGLKVVAEGVESAGVLELLRSMDCDVAQGYWVGRPLLAEQLQEWRLPKV